MTKIKTTIIVLFGLLLNTAVAQKPAEMTNEERDAAWTAEDTAREAAMRVPAAPKEPVVVDVLGMLVGEAEVIFRGVVESKTVVYEDGYAYTHTSFVVSEDLKGDLLDGDLFVLVQEGGPGRNKFEPAMMSSHSRHFNVGEEELLLLGPEEGHGVRDVQIRFRIMGDKVYDEDGRGVFVIANKDGNGHILRLSGDRNPEPRFTEIHIGDMVLHKRFSEDHESPEDFDSPDGKTVVAKAPAGRRYTEGAGLSVLTAAIKNQGGK